jgi:non-canonical poly(A) RNA polymerase PAPD5/7
MVTIGGDSFIAPPPPSDGLALDFELPELLCQDAVGRILCVVCNVYVPRGEMNAAQHLSGKKHATQARNVPHERILARKEVLMKQYAEERLNNPESAPAAAAAEASNEKPKSKPQATAAPVNEDGVAIVEVAHVLSARAKKVMELKALSIDSSGFLASVVGSDDDSSDAEVGGKGSAHGKESDDDVFAKVETRNGAFTPINYRAPADLPDVFFASMADEGPSTDKVDALRKILSSKASDPQPSVTTPVSEDTAEFVALLEPCTEDDNVTPPAKDEDAAIANGPEAVPASGPAEDLDDSGLPAWLVGEDAIEAVKYNPDSELALHYEILEFERFMSPTQAEASTRQELVETVTSIIQVLWPESRVEVFGSYATDLYLPTSDIDICVMNSPEGGGEAPTFHEHLELAQAIRNVKGMAKRVNFIKARVPLVKIVSRDSNVQCDISFNRMNGPGNVPVIRKYLASYPALRPLLMVLKCFLQQRSLNEVFSGGLGSYSVLLLVVSHLQMSGYNFPRANPNLGAALMNFFKLYGRTFNYCLAGIRVRGDGSYTDKFAQYQTTAGDAPRFSIEDPNDDTNELGRNSFAASRIRKAFTHGFSVIEKWRRADESGAASPLSSILHVDEMVLERRQLVLEDFSRRNTLLLFDSLREKIKSKAPGAAAQTDPAPGLAASRISVAEASNGASHAGSAVTSRSGGLLQTSQLLVKRRKRSNEFGTGFSEPEGHGFGRRGVPGVTEHPIAYGYAMNTYNRQGAPQMGEPYVPPGDFYNPGIQLAAQMPIDPYSGYAPDPMQLPHMPGLQYGQGAASGWEPTLQQQQQRQLHQAQLQQQQGYDPAYPQQVHGGFGQGQTWRAQHAGQRGGGGRGAGGGRGGLRGGIGSRGGGRGNGRDRGRGRGRGRR